MKLKARDDSQVILLQGAKDGVLVDVLSNDCASAQASSLKIIRQPRNGWVKIDEDGKIR